jgi:branched-chain amino acid transport system substrate-binding protein
LTKAKSLWRKGYEKLIALLLCALLCLALFSGCAGKKDDTIKGAYSAAIPATSPFTASPCATGELYVNKLNEAGGIDGKKVELVIYDNKADNAEAVTAFTRMVDEGITALIGDVLTGNTPRSGRRPINQHADDNRFGDGGGGHL